MARESLGPRVAAIYELQSVWLEPKLKKAGISWNTFQLLTAIEGAEERASQAEVARRIGVTPATLSETVQFHVQAGMLEQRIDGSDRRVKILVLTEGGREKMKLIREMVRDLESTMTKGLSDRTLQSVTSALDQVAENLETE